MLQFMTAASGLLGAAGSSGMFGGGGSAPDYSSATAHLDSGDISVGGGFDNDTLLIVGMIVLVALLIFGGKK